MRSETAVLICNLLVASLRSVPAQMQPKGCLSRPMLSFAEMAAVRIALANLPYPTIVTTRSGASSQRSKKPRRAARASCVFRNVTFPDTERRRERSSRPMPRSSIAPGRRSRGCRPIADRRHPRHRARHRSRSADLGARHQCRRHHRRVSGQGSDRSVGRNGLRDRRRPPGLSGRRGDVRRRDLPRGLALSRDRALARKRGAQVVFHPHFHEAEPGSYRPTTFADPANTFHEKAALCRAAENTCFFATVNYASDGSPTTSAVVRPDGTLLAYQPYGKAGLLIADLELDEATRLLATRCKEY